MNETLEVYEDEYGAFLVFGEAIMKEVGWNIGDTIEWIDNKDGTFTLRKVPEKESNEPG